MIPPSHALYYLAGGLCALLFGAGIALGLGMAVAPITLLIVATVVLSTFISQRYFENGGVLLLCLLLVAIPITYGETFVSRRFSSAADLWVFVAAISGLVSFSHAVRRYTAVRMSLAFLILYFAFGLASSAIGKIVPSAAAFQLIYNAKLPMVFAAGFAIAWSSERELMLRRVLLLAVFLALSVVAFQIAAPSLYRRIAIGSIELSSTPNPLLRGLLPRMAGPYGHSGMLATSASFAGSCFLIFLLISNGKWFWSMVGFLISALLVLLSGQQQETAGFLLTLIVILVATKTRPSISVMLSGSILLFIVFGALLLLIGDDQIHRLQSQWGLGDGYVGVDSARPVFTRDGVLLAIKSFPLGTGLGTYGSVGALNYDRSLYDSLGYGAFWWYRQGVFLLDTYWPNILAENGWFGAFAHFGFLLSLLVFVGNRFWSEVDPRRKTLFGMATAGHLIVMMTSLTSPIYGNPSGCVLLLIWTGIAVRESIENTRVGTLNHHGLQARLGLDRRAAS